MATEPRHRRGRAHGAQRGAITLVALCLTTTLGIALASYLALTSRSAEFSNRTSRFDQAHQLAQAGLEEALWALNQNNWASSGPEGNMPWSISGADRTATLTYPLSGAASSGTVVLTIANYASTGPTWPTVTAAATITAAGGQTFRRTLQATTAPAPLFSNAIASADSYVKFDAGGLVDSWNSDPDNNSATNAVAYSFSAGNAANYCAVIAGRTDGTYGVVLNEATIRGYVSTFGLPVSSSTSAPGQSVIGPATPAGVKVDTARIGKSAFIPVSVFKVTPPSTNGANFGGLIGNALEFLSILIDLSPDVDVYKTRGDLSITGVPLVAPSLTFNEPTKLIVDGDLVISGTLLTNGQITIGENGSLELYVQGAVRIGGHGFKNETNDPRKLVIYCLNSSATNALQYTTTNDFCGVIFSENNPIEIKQNGPFYGALLSRQHVKFTGDATNPQFHYDTALRNIRFPGVTTPYIVKQVTEL